MNDKFDSLYDCDVVLIGGGIMSATLGVFLKELQPDLKIEVFERLDKIAGESSDAWNNAGTGHSALCELNYTPELEDGTIDISKALKIAEQFETSKQFWAYLSQCGFFASPKQFINSTPHISLVWGEKNVAYLEKRHAAMQQHHFFKGMQYSNNRQQLMKWIPLIMEGRDTEQKIAATYMPIGTDVNFGALTQNLFQHLLEGHGVEIFLQHEVHHLHQENDKRWRINVKDLTTHKDKELRAKFVFIGAGGGALPLLEKSNIQEGKGYGGFPVSGQWLKCNNPDVIEKHHTKVYGKAAVGSPPMSVPHLDSRLIDGKKELLFGPYAGFSTRFLKTGSLLDLPASIHIDNILSMVGAGIHNVPLTKYLVEQVMQSTEDKFKALQEFFPEAKMEDWELVIAGQRVQVIKKDAEHGGVLEFGTEMVSAADGTIAALMGASPGASTAVPVMINLLNHCFKEPMKSEAWTSKLKQMIPAYGKELADDAKLCAEIRTMTSSILELTMIPASS